MLPYVRLSSTAFCVSSNEYMNQYSYLWISSPRFRPYLHWRQTVTPIANASQLLLGANQILFVADAVCPAEKQEASIHRPLSTMWTQRSTASIEHHFGREERTSTITDGAQPGAMSFHFCWLKAKSILNHIFITSNKMNYDIVFICYNIFYSNQQYSYHWWILRNNTSNTSKH